MTKQKFSVYKHKAKAGYQPPKLDLERLDRLVARVDQLKDTDAALCDDVCYLVSWVRALVRVKK